MSSVTLRARLGAIAAGVALAGTALTTATTSAHAATSAPQLSSTTTSSTSTLTAAQQFAIKANKVLTVAYNHRGDPYQWGAAGPNRFDCSGLVMYAFYRALGQHLPRTAEEQKKASHRIWHRANLRPGDLVFATTSSGYAYHVGIYAGNGYMWDAPHTGSHVQKQLMWPARWRYGRYIQVS
jgi:cell wall-associated NlpC family hydrolase